LHDLRRTAASTLEELEVDPTLISTILNQNRGLGVTETYLRGDKRHILLRALETLASHYEKMLVPVLALPAKAAE
jgi:hypothetical protein